ncbi:5-azacytidine resistance protein-like protein azr1 [Westerdykella ornata]|uniref:Protein phosphatase n=1 Tax=Westerdykella ornata TaxID=318751 RepID=A0A6A6J9Q5_WESOR|nr:5-azacytidine resistance protein-like protein azr1 [Westerdykella ornata]KAF2271969.1 5-azacytidine resistance protein-like protein azr1 [Westerdykella ornata]
MLVGILGLSSRLSPPSAAPLRRLTPSSSLLLVCLSASSLLAPISARHTAFHTQRALVSPSTCSVIRDTCPALPGVRSFHSTSQHWRTAPHFTYQVAAAYSAKGERFDPNRNVFTAGPFNTIGEKVTDIRKCKAAVDKRKRPRSGQDAFFYSQVGTTETTAFGVADGVGGWVDSGIDPADFSHGLCEYMTCAARLWPHGASSRKSLHPMDLLQVGYDEVIRDRDIVGGGSTACLAVAEPDGNVEVANLGDSGFMHLGLNAVRHTTQPQTHGFNTPFQLSKTPQRMLVQMAIFGGASALSDLPTEASITHHRVRHGDVLVFATDGVWDNLSPQDVLGVVSRTMVDLGAWVDKNGVIEVGALLGPLAQPATHHHANKSSLQARLATAIAKEAKETSHNSRRDGPFAREVQKWYPGENWHGGKPDDIAVVVAVVVEDSAL